MTLQELINSTPLIRRTWAEHALQLARSARCSGLMLELLTNIANEEKHADPEHPESLWEHFQDTLGAFINEFGHQITLT